MTSEPFEANPEPIGDANAYKTWKFRKNRSRDVLLREAYIPNFRTISSFSVPRHLWTDVVKFGIGRLIYTKVHPIMMQRRPTVGEKPHIAPSNLNNDGNFTHKTHDDKHKLPSAETLGRANDG